MDLENEKFFTVNETANILRIKNSEIYKLIKNNKLKAYRINSHGKRDKYNRKPWRIREKDLMFFIRQGANNGIEEK
jgi:excisionase family DNA binding protein